MQVAQLIRLLQLAPQHAEVALAGCDCQNDCASVWVSVDGNLVLLGEEESGGYIANGWEDNGAKELKA